VKKGREFLTPLFEKNEVNLEGIPKIKLKGSRDKSFTTNFSNKDQILTLLKSKALTSKELAEKLILSKQDTRTYLLRLKKDDKIKSIGKKGRFYVYTYKRPQDSETQYTLLHALEYDISYMLNLLEVKMTLKNGKDLSPTDMITINRLKNRISYKMENVRKETEVLNEYINEQGFRSKTNKKIIELEAKINYIESQNSEEFVESGKKEKPYQETENGIQLLESLSREKILLILEKAGIPEGYERKMVIVKNKIYKYIEYMRDYSGLVIKERQLFLLKDEVDDSIYFAENYNPRILFSYNNIVLTELLQKVDDQPGYKELQTFLDKTRKAPMEEKLNAFCILFEKIMQILLKSADLVDNSLQGVNSMVSNFQNQLTNINSDITSLKSRPITAAET